MVQGVARGVRVDRGRGRRAVPAVGVVRDQLAGALAGLGAVAGEIERAQELDPTSRAILADKGLMLYHSGKIQEGLELVKQVEQADPEFLSPHRYLAEIYLALREYRDFLAENEKMADLSHDQVLKDTMVAARLGFQRDGERGLLRELYAKQKQFHAEGKLSATALAITCARMGRKKEAVQLLTEDYDKHNPQFLAIRQDLELLGLMDEPGYQELVSRLHLPAPAFGDSHSAGQSPILASPQTSRTGPH